MNTSYLNCQRHILLDMHVPDWDARFLSRFDPERYVNLCAKAGAQAVMIYCNSHVGLCYWPTESGRMHRALVGRDAVGAQIDLLRERNIAVCAYYSGPIFNNWAFVEHPEWRIVASSDGGMAHARSRYGVVCPNHPACMDFMVQQAHELADRYVFDAFFFDMVFWPSVCVCASCTARYREESGADIPQVVDWYSSDWCRFQAARERWLLESYTTLRDTVKRSLDIPVFMNGANIKADWWAGVGHALTRANDILGGDFSHPSVLPTFASSTATVLQSMKPISAYGSGSSHLLPATEQKKEALTAAAFGGQFMAIDAIEPDGSVSSPVYERLADVFAALTPYDAFLGGTPIADVGIYFSQAAAVDFADNGTRIDAIGERIAPLGPPLAHPAAVEGAVRALREAHVPFTVLTRADLSRLTACQVVVLPNVLRMDNAEVAAFREYVARGGRVYVSGHTSLVTTDGKRCADFELADVLGCHFAGQETAAVRYLKPATPDVAGWIAPFAYVPHGDPAADDRTSSASRALRVTVARNAEVLATTTLPYADGRGSRDNQAWASIHNSPPWSDTGHPAIVRHRFGAGEALYAAMDIEASASRASASAQLFVGLIRSLLTRRLRFEATTHRNVWVTAFDDSDERRTRICFVNYGAEADPLPVPRVRFRLSAPPGATISGLYRLPDSQPIAFSRDEDGGVSAELPELQTFVMLAAPYADSDS